MRYLLIFLFALCAAVSFSGCSYSNNYKNYQDYQSHDDDDVDQSAPKSTNRSR
jgi:outer membrane protein assembly factor BamE (lipoprotein component of BamABCDE complex)